MPYPGMVPRPEYEAALATITLGMTDYCVGQTYRKVRTNDVPLADCLQALEILGSGPSLGELQSCVDVFA